MLIIVVIVIFIYLYIKNIYVKSNIDNTYYYVQRDTSNKSVIILSKLRKMIKQIINNINEKDLVYKSNINQFNNIKENINNFQIEEKSIYDTNASYTINKKKIILCLKDEENNYYNFNELLYILIHELAHVICPDIGHTKAFYDINVFLLKEAVNLGLYKPVNYKENPINYCGILLNEYLL